MRRFAYLAILPSLFMMFTEVEPRGGSHSVIIDMEGATVKPAYPIAKEQYPGTQTVIRTRSRDSYFVTTPFEEVSKAIQHRDLRPDTPGMTPPR